MVAYSFQERFVLPIEEGTKRQSFGASTIPASI
jgi:hypothetical protein